MKFEVRAVSMAAYGLVGSILFRDQIVSMHLNIWFEPLGKPIMKKNRLKESMITSILHERSWHKSIF